MKPLLTETFCIEPIENISNWDDFVASHSAGSIFHTRAMVSAMSATPKYEPLAIAAVTPDGEIVGLLVAVKISIAGPWPGRLSARSVFFAEPLCASGPIGLQAHKCLLREHDRVMQDQVVFAELRPLAESTCDGSHNTSCGYEFHDYNNYELDLRQDLDVIFANMSRTRRNNIRDNEQRGITVRVADPEKDLGIFYDFLAQSYSKSHVPLVDPKHFAEVFDALPPEQYRLTIAELNGKPIASSCHLIFKGRVYWWQAGMQRTPGLTPQATLVWETIQWAASHGELVYDFAGAGWGNETYGPGVFKSRFGGKHINTGRYRKVYSKLRMKIAKVGYQLTSPLLSSPISYDQNDGKQVANVPPVRPK